MTAQDHNRTLGILFLVYGGLQTLGLLIVGIAMLVMGGALMVDVRNDDAMPVAVFAAIMIIALVVSVALLIPVYVAGINLLKGKPNARVWGIVASIIAVLNIPLGTILGAYGLWFLFGDVGKLYYLAPKTQGNYTPAPLEPGSWQ